MKLQAPAKINLGLSIESQLADGYHRVNLINCQVSLFDEIRLKTRGKANIPYGKKNTVAQALKLLGKEFIIEINKHIPSGSGLGGGSSDAAQVLKAFGRLDLASQVGQDVVYAGRGGVKLEKQGNIKGSSFTPLPDLPDCYFVICVPKKQIKTSWAYRQIDSMKFKPASLRLLVKAIKNRNLAVIARDLVSDFSVLAKKICPEVNQIQQDLLASGALGVSISGKGPATFGIFANKIQAAKAKKQLQKHYRQTYLVQPLKENHVY